MEVKGSLVVRLQPSRALQQLPVTATSSWDVSRAKSLTTKQKATQPVLVFLFVCFSGEKVDKEKIHEKIPLICSKPAERLHASSAAQPHLSTALAPPTAVARSSY